MKASNEVKARYKRTKVYLEDRYEKPKHMFVVMADKIAPQIDGKSQTSLLDVGGATGEFVYYLHKRFPDLKVSCLEYDSKLVSRGRERLPTCNFVTGDANNMDEFSNNQFNIVTMIGTMSIFNNFEPSLSECIRTAKPQGIIYVVGQFNDFPVDALIQWRYSNSTGPYNTGYNLFSKETISAFLTQEEKVTSWDFEKFSLPFDLKKQEDPIRTWTELNNQGERIFRNGIMEINLQILQINLK